jgi:hypothetical protein
MKVLQLCISAVFALLSSLTGVHASEVYVSCEGCSASQASAAASGEAVPNSSIEVYVFNTAGETIWKFWVFSTYEEGELFTVTTPHTVEPAVKSEFDDWMYVKDYEYVLDVRITEESSGIGSAYELWGAGSGANHVALEDAVILEHAGIWGKAILSGGALSALGQTVSKTLYGNQPFYLTIEFDDATMCQVVWQWHGSDPGVLVLVKPGTSIDSEYNLIPENATEARNRTANFSGNSSNISAWTELVQRYSLTVVSDSGGSGYTCQGNCDTSGCTVTCIRN